MRWFNVWAGIEKRMPAGSTVTISGVVRKRDGRFEFANPDILAIDIPVATDQSELASAPAKKPLPKLIARYPEVAGVPASKLRAACQTACARVGASADDGVPASVEEAARLPALAATLSMLHSPPDDIAPEELASLNRGDEPVAAAAGVRRAVRARRRGRAEAARALRGCGDAVRGETASVDAIVRRRCRSQPTGAQTRTIGEIAR